MPWSGPARDIIRSSLKDGDGGGSAAAIWDLVAELASTGADRRRRAIERIQEHGRTDLAPFLLNLLKSVDAGVRRDTAETLGLIGYEIVADCGEVLAGLLYDVVPEVREEAVVAIWRLGFAGAVPELQKLMCFDASAAVRLAVARVLTGFDEGSSSGWVRAKPPRTQSLPLSATEAGNGVYFEHALADPDAAVRAHAAVGLGLSRSVDSNVRLDRLIETESDPLARAGLLCGAWLLGGGSQVLEEFLRMAHDRAIAAEMCHWIHLYLDRKPASEEARRDVARIRTALRGWPEAAELIRRIALWQGEQLLAKARAAEL